MTQSRLQRLAKGIEGVNSVNPVLRKEKGSSTAWEADLEKQMQAWTENPSWVDRSPEIKVRVEQQKCSSWFSNEL